MLSSYTGEGNHRMAAQIETVEMPEEVSLVQDIVRAGRIRTRWQPICSIKKGSIVGFEALSTGIDAQGNPVNPVELFAMAEEKRLTLDLDRLCRTRAIENFAEVRRDFFECTLFMNLDTSIIDRGVVGSGHLQRTVERAGLDARQIVLEIIESRTANLRALKEFIETYRERGFLIALDDVGAGHSNLDRIAQIKPDLIKIDRLMVETMNEYHAREVFRALTNLAHATGALVVAEGIENEDQALRCLELGADLLQGYFLARPQAVSNELIEDVNKKSTALAAQFRAHVLGRIQAKVDLFRRHLEVLNAILERFKAAAPEQFDNLLEDTVTQFNGVEFAYVLNDSGLQASHTIGHPQNVSPNRHFLFEPAAPGTDHGLKDYVLLLASGRDRCVTEPYISLATGNICQTCSAKFFASDGRRYILCVDIIENSV